MSTLSTTIAAASASQRQLQQQQQQQFPDYPLFNTYKLLQIPTNEERGIGGEGGGGGGSSSSLSGSGRGSGEGTQRRVVTTKSRGHMLTPRASTSSGNLSEQGAGDQGQQQQPQGQGEEEERGVFISLVASAYSPGYPDVGHAITAIALTTSQKGDNLLIRYVGESNVPSVQQIPWSKDFGTKIVGLSFDPSAQWLLAASADGTLCVLPAYFLCSKKVALTGSAATATAAMMTAAATAGSGTTLSTSKPHILRVKKPQGNVSACAWWKPSAKTSEYGVVGTTGGQVTFVDLITGEEVYSVKVRGAVTGLSIVDDRHDYKYLLISTDKSGSGRLFLELSTGAYRNLLAAVRHQKESGTMPPDFVVEGLPQLPRSARVVVQETPNFGPVITAFDPTSCVLEIYGAELGKFPLFSYQLPAGAVGFHFTRHVTFVFVDPASAVAPANDAGQRTQHLQLPPPQRPSIYVVSNRIASRLTTVRSSTRRELCSVMQRFCLESDERFGGTFYIPTTGGVSSSSSSISSVDGGEDESSGAQGGGSSAGGLHGCFVWTTRSLLDCEPATRPEDLFRQLVAQGLERTDAEDFGKTLGLDLYTLYEQSADACFERGEYERALDLYALSNVRSSKLVLRYLGIDRLDVVIAHLGARLRRAETLPAGDRAALANLLFQASLLRLLPSNTGNNNNNSGNSKDTADFEEFLVTNMDYDAEAAMRHLLAQGPGFLKLLLLAAHSRRRVPEALMLLCKRGRIHLPREHVEFLLENGYGAELSKCHSLLEVLPPDAQVHCILDSPQTLPYNFRSLWGLLPRASGDTLFRVVALLSPRSPILPVLLDPEPLPRNAFLGQLPAQPPSPIKPEEICELRLAALMVLAAHHYKPSPAALTAAAAAATTTTTTPATTGLPTDSETKDTNAQQQQQQVIPPSSLQPQPQRMFNQICCGYNHVLAVTESGELYSWGSNTYGQLGHGTTFGVCYPKRVERLAGDPVLRIAAGGAHSFAVMYNAAVWAWGLNASGQLGIGVDYDPDKYKTAPVPVDAFRGLLLKQIACGHAHTLFVADDGRIFACGDNTHGQLGIGAAAAAASTYSSSPVLLSSSSSSSSLTTTTPTLSTSPSMFGGGSSISSTSGTGYCCCQTPTYVRIQSTHRIHSVACGYDHSCACTEAGKVYTWGYGDQGQLGHGVFEDESTPRAVATLSSKYITAIYCGHYCTAALTDLSDVYTWGRNTNGELGHGEGPNTAEPRPVQSIAHEQVAALACGSTHTLAVCDSGKLYAWGYSKAGALGLGSGEEEISTTPKRVQAPPLQRPVACDCGDNFNVLLAVPEEPQKKEGSAASAVIATYTWGNNAEGQLGTVEISDVGNELRESVREEWGQYRPEVVLSNALLFGMWDIAIQIHELAGAWSHAFMSKLLEVQAKGLPKDEEAQAMLKISAASLDRLATARAGDEVLRQFFDMWHSRGLAEEPLTAFIVEHAEALAPAISALLLKDSTDQPWLDKLPPEARMRIVRTALFGMCEKGARAGDVPAATLWSEIWANLPRDAGRRDVIILSGNEIAAAKQQQTQQQRFRVQQLPAQSQRSRVLLQPQQQQQQHQTSPSPQPQLQQGTQRGGEFVVFTCGHKYTPHELNTSVLPNFVQLVESLPTPLPITAQLAVAEYKQRSISLACPVCLYNNFLRNEHATWKP